MSRLELGDAIWTVVMDIAKKHRPVAARGYPPATTIRLDADTTAFYRELADRMNMSFNTVISMALTSIKDSTIMDARKSG